MENLAMKVFPCALVLLMACGSSKDEKKSEAPTGGMDPSAQQGSPNAPDQADAQKQAMPPGQAPSALPLTGKITTVAMQQIDLQKDGALPTVLIFAQDSCAICAGETKAIISRLKDAHKAPSKINLYTVLIGATVDDARDWVGAYGPPWQVGYDEHLELFQAYFPKGTKVPAIVVRHPKQGIVLQQSGEISVDALQKLTGPWEDPS